MKYFTLAFKRFNDVTGVSSRKEYWMYFLIVIIVFFVLGLIGAFLDSALGANGTIATILGLVILVIILPGISLGIRRLHDAGFSGWWWLLNFIPYVGSLILIFLYVQKTKTIGNKYAPMVAAPMPPVTPV